MNLIKTSFFTGIATIIKISASFIISKVVAVYIGPTGLAIIGQFQNFSQIIQSFANGAITQGIIKYIAEYRQNLIEKKKILSTAIFISTLSSIVVGLSLFFLRHFLAVKLLKSAEYSTIFAVFAFTVILFSLNTFLISVLNGEQDIRKYIAVNIAASISGLILTCSLSIYFHLFGALLSLVLNQSVVFFVTLAFVIKCRWFTLDNFFNRPNKSHAVRLIKFSLMAITTALTMPIAQIIIRNHIGETLSWDNAGYWQAISKISDVYLLLITTTLAVYYLPRLSEIKDKITLKTEVIYGYKIILPTVCIFALSIFLFKKPIMYILFTSKFYPMLPLFKFQLLGDIMKVGSWLLAYIMLAKAMTKIFISTEIIFSTSYVVLAYVGLHYFGLQGVTIAFAINYALYWIAMVFVIKYWAPI